ncbi:MAG: DegV family protein [Anaerolineae bacterium]
MAVHVVADSASDIPPVVAEMLGITQVPVLVQLGNETFRDRVDLQPSEFYERVVNSKIAPKTAANAPGVYTEAYEHLTADGDSVLSITVAASLSGIYNSARIGAQEFGDKVVVVDSTSASMGEGLIAIQAARAAEKGASLAELNELCQQLAPKTHVWAALNTLEFLHRGGRLSATQAFVGSLLQVKPILDVYSSNVTVVERIRTMRKAIDKLVELVKTAGPASEMCILYSGSKDLADEVRARLADDFPANKVFIAEAGPSIGTHAGPGAVGVAAILK